LATTAFDPARTDKNRAPFIPERQNDWDYARVQWENTDKSAVAIAAEIGVSPTMVISRASNGGWLRDRSHRTADAAARIFLAEREAIDERRRAQLETIERVNVAMQAEVLVTHRKDIKAAREVCTALMDQLLTAQAVKDKERGTLEELGGKATVMLKLSNSMKTLILLERQALGVQTAIMDPEAEAGNQTPESTALDLLMNKFASVLQHQQPPQVIVDVSSVASAEQGRN